MLSDADKKAILDSWRLVVPIADTAADLFYRRLFELAPAYREYFKSDMASQKRKLVAMLAFVVKSLDWPESAWRQNVEEEDDLFLVVLALGRRHSDLYHIPDSTYATVGEALIWTLDYGLGKKFDKNARAAWTKVYGLLATTMKMGRLSVQPMESSTALVQKVVGPGVRTS
ncbi:MAG: nitric oxide dioxygenase [Myxococcales bacterium]|nr:nitric oxide dioxygenase [Myxococcales bacterium]HRC58837.1 globin domain-containing protein [Kofleriaceae bacterium]